MSTESRLRTVIEDAIPDLNEILEYLEDAYDANDSWGEDGNRPAPNTAMSLGMRLERIIADMERGVE